MKKVKQEEKELTQQKIAKIIKEGQKSGSLHLKGSREEMIAQFRQLKNK